MATTDIKKKKGSGDIAPEFKTTSAADWKKNSKRKGHEMVLPSGFTCKATRVNLAVFMKTGRIPNSLRSLIDQAMSGKEIDQQEVLDKLLEGDEKALKTFEDMMTMVDAVVCEVMLEPKVIPAPETEEERSDTLLHVDEMDEEDRIFVFNFATGGTRDLEPFRQGQAANVERILAQQGGGSTTE